jgi:hypothetical protein
MKSAPESIPAVRWCESRAGSSRNSKNPRNYRVEAGTGWPCVGRIPQILCTEWKVITVDVTDDLYNNPCSVDPEADLYPAFKRFRDAALFVLQRGPGLPPNSPVDDVRHVIELENRAPTTADSTSLDSQLR